MNAAELNRIERMRGLVDAGYRQHALSLTVTRTDLAGLLDTITRTLQLRDEARAEADRRITAHDSLAFRLGELANTWDRDTSRQRAGLGHTYANELRSVLDADDETLPAEEATISTTVDVDTSEWTRKASIVVRDLQSLIAQAKR